MDKISDEIRPKRITVQCSDRWKKLRMSDIDDSAGRNQQQVPSLVAT